MSQNHIGSNITVLNLAKTQEGPRRAKKGHLRIKDNKNFCQLLQVLLKTKTQNYISVPYSPRRAKKGHLKMKENNVL